MSQGQFLKTMAGVLDGFAKAAGYLEGVRVAEKELGLALPSDAPADELRQIEDRVNELADDFCTLMDEYDPPVQQSN